MIEKEKKFPNSKVDEWKIRQIELSRRAIVERERAARTLRVNNIILNFYKSNAEKGNDYDGTNN